MKTILLNGVEQTLDTDQIPFHKLIDDLNASLAQDSRVISCIKIDGAELTADDQEKLSSTALGTLGAIEIVATSPLELAYETLNTLEAYLERILQNIERAGTMYRSKNYITADSYFLKTVDGLDLFVQTMGGVKATLRVGAHPRINVAEATLISIMNDLLDAKKANNYILLSDLLLTDLTENLKEWRDEVFAVLRTKSSN